MAGAIGELPRLPAQPAAAASSVAVSGSAPAGRSPAAALPARFRRLTIAAGRDVRPALELNRVPLRALAVILLAGLALLAAVGAFGIDAAARAAGPVLPSPAAFVGG